MSKFAWNLLRQTWLAEGRPPDTRAYGRGVHQEIGALVGWFAQVVEGCIVGSYFTPLFATLDGKL